MLSTREMYRYTGRNPLLSELTAEAVFGDNPDLFGFRKSLGKMLEAYKEIGWVEYGEGRHRVVYGPQDGAYVVKISRTMAGAQANRFEWLSARHKETVRQVKWNVDVPVPMVLGYQVLLHSVSLLFVEKVTRLYNWIEHDDGYLVQNHDFRHFREDWMSHVDADEYGPQVGKTASGRIVCFDWCPF